MVYSLNSLPAFIDLLKPYIIYEFNPNLNFSFEWVLISIEVWNRLNRNIREKIILKSDGRIFDEIIIIQEFNRILNQKDNILKSIRN